MAQRVLGRAPSPSAARCCPGTSPLRPVPARLSSRGDDQPHQQFSGNFNPHGQQHHRPFHHCIRSYWRACHHLCVQERQWHAICHTLTVDIIGDTTDTVIANVLPATGDANTSNANWANVGPVAIPGAALGQPVRIEWRFVGNGDGSYNGAYIDDVSVTSP